jgi:hypothetical protein
MKRNETRIPPHMSRARAFGLFIVGGYRRGGRTATLPDA